MKKFNKLSSDFYLSLKIANDYPEQEPAHRVAKWYDLFWLLVPMAGFLIFAGVIENRYNHLVQ